MPSLMRVAGVLFALGLSACPDEVQELRFHVTVRDDQGAVQSAALIELDGLAIGSTNHEGKASFAYQAHADRARLSVRCADGYRPLEPRSVPLSRHGQPPPKLEFVCRPKLRSLLLVVRAPLAVGLPVLADGESLGTVAADGTLHAALKRAPDSDLRISLDTTDARALAPQHPVQKIKVRDEDQIIVFDQVLAPVSSRSSSRR